MSEAGLSKPGVPEVRIHVPQPAAQPPKTVAPPLAAPPGKKLSINYGHAAEAQAATPAQQGPDHSIGLPDQTWVYIQMVNDGASRLSRMFGKNKETLCIFASRQPNGQWHVQQLEKDGDTYSKPRLDLGVIPTTDMVNMLSAFAAGNAHLRENSAGEENHFNNWVLGYNANRDVAAQPATAHADAAVPTTPAQ